MFIPGAPHAPDRSERFPKRSTSVAIRITARNKMVVEPGFKELIQKKCDRLSRHFEKVECVEVIMQEEKFRFRVEILMQAGHFHAAALTEANDLGAAFDGSLKRVESQIARQAKKQSERGRGKAPAHRKPPREEDGDGDDD